jgi:hypothetical protein
MSEHMDHLAQKQWLWPAPAKFPVSLLRFVTKKKHVTVRGRLYWLR